MKNRLFLKYFITLTLSPISELDSVTSAGEQCVRQRGGGTREQENRSFSLSLTLKASDPKRYTVTMSGEDFLCIVVLEAHFCLARDTRKTHGGGPSSLRGILRFEQTRFGQ
ncbi:hypothetical protein EYF80_023895 [Liparis tanakae]|uniref:Secreted protein n=1 Tax=Liparis tanakae TaxID=230148 RepID=A0A4Z2HKR1_9TELE|nr:hypothetical protein EYF80_023895 [Liparis tanakae]